MRTLLYIWHSFFIKSYPEEVADALSYIKPECYLSIDFNVLLERIDLFKTE